jgi:hypothetical protein
MNDASPTFDRPVRADELSPAQRMREIAAILAAGVLRLRKAASKAHANQPEASCDRASRPGSDGNHLPGRKAR